MYLPYYEPLFGYQNRLFENSNFEDADYFIMGINSYFRNQGYEKLQWDDEYKRKIFSKKIIMISEEDITIFSSSFNKTSFQKHVKYVIGSNDKLSLEHFLNTPYDFTHLSFAFYVENHKTSYNEFINRPYYIQTAISNVNFFVNSNRVHSLLKCMEHFGPSKIANFGALFFNQKK